MKVNYIDRDEELNPLVIRLEKCSEIALDLEFDRNSFGYGFVLCLIQIFDGKEISIIDPFAIKDLNKLWKIFENEAIVKVLHNASEDILLLKDNNCKVKNVWDTEKAAMLLNFEKIGLNDMLDQMLNKTLDKNVQRTNWRKRPLSSEQIKYAGEDVVHLLKLKGILESRLKSEDKIHWLNDEGSELENLEKNENKVPFLKYKGARELDRSGVIRLSKFYALRDQWAERENKPPFQILRNEYLADLCRDKNIDFRNWNKFRPLNPKYRNLDSFEEFQRQMLLPDTEFEIEKPERIKKNQVINDYLIQIKLRLQEKYGEQCTRLVLSQGIINEIHKSNSIGNLKPYARNLILEAADDLGININNLK